MKMLCIFLNAFFMSHEPCKRHWKKKKKEDAGTFSFIYKPTLKRNISTVIDNL